MNAPLSRTPSIAARTRGTRWSYCALTSTSGIWRTTRESRRPPPPHQEPYDAGDNGGHDQIVHEAEVVVECLVALAESKADAREGETPDGRADEREDGVASERHSEDAGGDRDERADDRSDSSEQHRPVSPLLEPVLRAVEFLAAQVEPAAVPFEQRPTAVEPDRPAGDRADEITERSGQGHRHVGPAV